MSSVDIGQLIEDFPFEVSTVQLLEDSLVKQSENRSYNFAANKALLKNYQVHAPLVKIDMISKILILALMQLPSNDYSALSYMVPVVVTSNPNISYISSCSNLLERGQYREFWQEYSNAPSDLFSGISGFVEAIQSFILHSLRDTFKNIPTSTFGEFLGISSEQMNSFMVANSNICEVKGDVVVFVTTQVFSKPKPKFDDAVKVDEVLRIVDLIRAMDSI